MEDVRLPWTFVVVLVVAAAAPAQGPEDPFPAELLAESADPGFARIANPAFPSPQVHAVPLDRGPKIERAELAPYFASGRLADARAAFEAGRFDRARALLDGEKDTAPVRYLRALAAWRAGDHAFAAPELEALAAAWAPLRDRCLVHAGQAYEASKDWESAARVFAAVSKASRLYPDGRLGLSRAKRHLKAWAEAAEALAPFVERPAPPWGRDVGAEALWAQAELASWRDDKKGERAALLKLWAAHPLSREGRKAEARLGGAAAPTEALVTRGEALIDAHRNAQGVALVEPLLAGLKLPEATACRASFAVGKGYRKLRRHAKAVQLLGPVAARCRDPELRARVLFTLGFSQGFVAPAQAVRTYTALANDYPDHAFADDSLFFAAEAALGGGQRDAAVGLLVDLVDRYPTADYAADALFKLFWIHRAEAQSAEAEAFLAEIEGRFATQEDGHDVERARYWRARTLEAAGRREEALAMFESVARERPAGYYGLIARERVEAADPERGARLVKAVAAAPGAADLFPIHAGPLAADPQFVSAVELLRLGFGELVPAEILAVDRTGLPSDSLRLMVQVLALSGEERPAHGLARLWLRRDLSGRITMENRATWEIAYPKAFRDLVTKHAEAADKLDPDLLQALMREESALDPKALSWAGALGLCQLMPPTAAEVAAQLKLKRPTQAELLEPDLNLRLGAKYLADVLARQKGVKQHALAGYNAGEGAVRRWRRDFPTAEVDEWVEQIPVQETRNYVKRVLRSYNTYKLLYSPTEPPRTQTPVGKPTSAGAKTG